MNKKRVIARLDVKNSSVIKGIHLEGLRKVGDPNELAKKYYLDGVDEIIFMDAVAAYYDRNSLSEIISEACKDVFIPITVGGGVRSIEDIQAALNNGADKVAINTKAVQAPGFISDASRVFGSQCIVASIVAKQIGEKKWEVYVENGREPTGRDVIDWARQVEQLGAGEIMLTSVDMEGTKKGFDESLVSSVVAAVNIPVIASGGAGQISHVIDIFSVQQLDGIALASMLHYGIEEIDNIKREMAAKSIRVRV